MNTGALKALGLDMHQAASGLCLVGGTGSGKTSVMRILADAILRYPTGSVFMCVKADSADDAANVIEGAGRDKFRFAPGNPVCTFNPAAYELSRLGGTPQTLTNFLIRANRILMRSKGDKGDEHFWENLFRQVLEHAVTVCWHAYGQQITFEHIYRVITTSPASPHAAQDPAFISTYCGEALNRAFHNVKMSGDPAATRAMDSAWDFWAKSFSTVGDKAKGAALSFVSGVLAPFLIEPLYSTCCQPISTITPNDVLDGKNVVLDAPVLVYGDAGRLFQLLFYMLTMDAALRRPIHADSPHVVFFRDEYQWLAEPEFDVMAQTVARSQRIVSVTAFQTLPVLQAALGGTLKAEQDAFALTACHQTKFLLAQNCHKTAQWASDLCGHKKKLFGHFGQAPTRPEGNGFINDIMGVGSYQASFSEQWHHKLPPHTWSQLRTGSDRDQGVIDAILHVAGRTFEDGDCFKKVAFRRASYRPERRKRFWG